MSIRTALWRIAVSGLLPVLVGCSDGADVPLTAPGGGDWPADRRWLEVPDLFTGRIPIDAAWDPVAGPDDTLVVVTTGSGEVLEYAGGRWSARPTGAAVALAAVAATGRGSFVAVGEDGAVCRRTDTGWRNEDAGTDRDLVAVTADAGDAWAVGAAGTVRRGRSGVWTALPSPGPRDLLGVAARAESLFVVAEGSDSLLVWAGAGWEALRPGPWAGRDLKAVAVFGADELLVFADSLYNRGSGGWQTVGQVDFADYPRIRLRTTGNRVWFLGHRVGGLYPEGSSWRTVRRDGDTWLSVDWVYGSGQVMAARDDSTIVRVTDRGEIVWVSWSSVQVDPVSRPGVHEAFPLAGDGLGLVTAAGVQLQGATGRTLLHPWADLPGLDTYGVYGAGRSRRDFFLADRDAVYHCRDGVPTLVTDQLPDSAPRSIAVDGEGVLHVAGEGVWRWLDGRWEQLLPRPGATARSVTVWPLGDGRLGCRDAMNSVAVLDHGAVIPVGTSSREEGLIAGEDGTLFQLDRVYLDDFSRPRNLLRVWDERAGALRDVGSLRMGPLADLELDGMTSSGGRPLVWTSNPTFVFTLVGSPLQADWQRVTGASGLVIEHLVRLDDGTLLALDSSAVGFHLYRP